MPAESSWALFIDFMMGLGKGYFKAEGVPPESRAAFIDFMMGALQRES